MKETTTTLSEDLRASALQAMGRCASCGRGGLSIREAASDAGVPSATFFRFLKGKSVQSETLDSIAAWLKHGDPRKEGK